MIRLPHSSIRFHARRTRRPWIAAAVIPLAILPLAACSGISDSHRGHNGIDISVAPFTPIPDGATYVNPPHESSASQTPTDRKSVV